MPIFLFLFGVFWSLPSQALDIQGKLIADNGFRPKPNGFNFENWGGQQHPDGDLSADDVRYLFGDRVCAYIEDDECHPTPAAESWMAQMNQIMQGGHCEGMAALSAAFFQQEEAIQEYGAATPYTLPADDYLLRTISTYFTTQFLEPVLSETEATREMSLSDIIKQLRDGLKQGQEYYTLGIYAADGGHAITPFALEQLDANRFRIHVYDNNYPGESKYVEVNTDANTWTYAAAALNPSEDPEPWTGGAGDMDLTALSVRYEPLICPFCDAEEADEETDAEDSTDAQTEADSEAVAQETDAEDTDTQAEAEADSDTTEHAQASQGVTGASAEILNAVQQLSAKIHPPFGSRQAQAPRPQHNLLSALTNVDCSQVEIKNPVTGAIIKAVENQFGQHEVQLQRIRGSRGCFVQLPAEQEYRVGIRGGIRGSKLTEEEDSISFFRPGQVFNVSGLKLQQHQTESFHISPHIFSYIAGKHSAPDISLATDQIKGKNAMYKIKNAVLEAGRSFSIHFDKDVQQVSFQENDPKLQKFSIRALVSHGKQLKNFDFDKLETDNDGTVMMELKNATDSIDIIFKKPSE